MIIWYRNQLMYLALSFSILYLCAVGAAYGEEPKPSGEKAQSGQAEPVALPADSELLKVHDWPSLFLELPIWFEWKKKCAEVTQKYAPHAEVLAKKGKMQVGQDQPMEYVPEYCEYVGSKYSERLFSANETEECYSLKHIYSEICEYMCDLQREQGYNSSAMFVTGVSHDFDAFERVGRCRGRSAEARFVVGVVYFKMGDLKEASKYFRDYLRQEPNGPFSPDAMMGLGQILFLQGDYGLASKQYVAAIDLSGRKDPFFLLGRYFSAWSYYLNGEQEKAQEAINDAYQSFIGFPPLFEKNDPDAGRIFAAIRHTYDKLEASEWDVKEREKRSKKR